VENKIDLRNVIMNKPKIIQYLYSNCFLFFIPVILFDIAFTKYLPEQYLKNISHIIVPIETTVRMVLIALATIMKINIQDKKGKIGFGIYITGLITYFISYFILINYADTVIGKNIILQLSGYWTATLWLMGIGLTGNRLFVKVP
jgi:hypothetical protein